ncbi:MAG TPA: ABC transporter substrate-binding protein [Egibacteraceae bacterium]|nr:ABC transporter substrate-binding protein [Egibacteraceae bacterium]
MMFYAAMCERRGRSPSGGRAVDHERTGVELQVWLFGDFGYDALIEEYQEANPDVTVVTKTYDADAQSYRAYHEALGAAVVGDSSPDVVAIDVGYIAAFKARRNSFHDLLELGARELEGDYLAWKWRQGLISDGSALIGLSTDIGPMTVCYRRDLLGVAELASDRDELAELWDSWEAFISFGQRYTAATGKAFLNAGAVIFETVVNQSLKRYYDVDGRLIYDSNPRVKHAWDLAAAAIGSGITAGVPHLGSAWSTALSRGDFAAVPCPAWMRPFVEHGAPDTAGDWDMTLMPKRGGNWGGSFLALPAGSDKPEEAFKLMSWLLAPAQQLKVFQTNGNFPSTPALYDSPEIQGFSSAFFNDAPIGQLYAASALANIEPFDGPADGLITAGFIDALGRVEAGAETPDQAWDSALAGIRARLRR